MVIVMNEDDFKLVDLVLEDYVKNNSTDKKCPYCGTPLSKQVIGSSYSVSCKTKDCFQESFRGI